MRDRRAFVFLSWYTCRMERQVVLQRGWSALWELWGCVSWGCCGPLFDLEVFLVSSSAARLALLQHFFLRVSSSIVLLGAARALEPGRPSARRIPAGHCCCPAPWPRYGGFVSPLCLRLCLTLSFFSFPLCLCSVQCATCPLVPLLNKSVFLLNELHPTSKTW